MKGRKGSPGWADYKNKKRLSRQRLFYIPNPEFLKLIPPADDNDREFIKAPDEFSVLTNRGPVIEFFKSVLENVYTKVYSVMDMSAISSTDLATISLLISVMMDQRSKEALIRKYMTVYTPSENTLPGQLFRKAQFHQTVTKQGIADHTFFLSRRSTKVNADYIDDILKYTENFLGANSTETLSPVLVEIISNTNNHANPSSKEGEDKIPWFLSVLEDREANKMIFSVVDLGVGIFESLKLKGLANTDNLFEDAIKDMYANSQSKFLRTNIPKGVDSSTGLFYRGQGLQTVHALVKSSNYDTFTIVTNRAAVNLKSINDNHRDSAESLGGTIYYWEMSSNG